MSNPAPQHLVILYQKMADLTAPECTKCRVPHSCCSPEYCETAELYAAEEYGIELQETGYPNPKGLLFMSATGCTVPPYLRPSCTLHTCDINGMGFHRTDMGWTKTYFKLRQSIEEAEYQRVISEEENA